MEAPQLLVQHLSDWLGLWPSQNNGITVVGSHHRVEPGWDGDIRDVLGVSSPTGAVLSVPPSAARGLAEIVRGNSVDEDLALLNEHKAVVSGALGRSGQFGGGYFRWSLDPTPGDDVGDWVPTDDPRVPEWLKPFNGDVLIAWDDDGNYGAGVGLKKHDAWGFEISVGTEESLRGRGMARRLVATATREILRQGRVATYLHAPDNFASGKVADAAGFPDHGWKVLGYWGSE